MKLYCPRCDVEFIKDLARCPGCGWDFRAHVIPDGFLKKPHDFTPLKELPHFLVTNLPIVFINGIMVQLYGFAVGWIIFRITSIFLRFLFSDKVLYPESWLAPFVIVLAFVMVFPIWANYMYSLLRRYRYHVAVPLFSIIPPRGTFEYIQILAWAPWCFLIAAILLIALIVPGIVFLFIFLPILLLITLDKRNISSRRRVFILSLTFKKMWLPILLIGLVLAVIWSIVTLFIVGVPYGLILAAFLFPIQSVFSTLLYESILGRVNLDVG
jgi:hypothetical protein